MDNCKCQRVDVTDLLTHKYVVLLIKAISRLDEINEQLDYFENYIDKYDENNDKDMCPFLMNMLKRLKLKCNFAEKRVMKLHRKLEKYTTA